jgi:ABC-type multidrug transport system ATPase subunit
LNNSPLALINLHEVEKYFGRNRALKIDDLTISQGDTISLIGGNGSGKSTLLRILAGVSQPNKGQVVRFYKNKNVRIGYVPQRGGVYPNLTVAENILLRARLFGVRLCRDLCDDPVVSALRIASVLSVPAGNLSDGYAHLCALACMLSVKPQHLYLDEPFAGLDGIHSVLVTRFLADISSKLDVLVISGHESRFSRPVQEPGGPEHQAASPRFREVRLRFGTVLSGKFDESGDQNSDQRVF